MLEKLLGGGLSFQGSSSAMSGMAPITTPFNSGEVYFKTSPTPTQAVNQLPLIIGFVLIGALLLRGKI